MSRHARLLRLAHLLGGRRAWKVADLARELEVTPRTIYRDIDELSACGVTVVNEGPVYSLLDDGSLPPLNLNPVEWATILLALGNPALERHDALRRRVRDLRTKLRAASAVMEETPLGLRLASVDRSGPIDETLLDALETAIRDRRPLRILYQSLSGGTRTWRGFDPYDLFHRAEAWYVAGRCHLHDEPRTFRLDRIANTRPLDGTFTRPQDFDLARYLEDSWGVYRGAEPHDVVIVFDPALAPLIDNARHHPGEKKKRLPSGEIEYRVRVSHLDEIARWVMGFAGGARALEPAELRERIGLMAGEVLGAHRRPARRVAKEGTGRGEGLAVGG